MELKEFNTNIIKWYEFKNYTNILQVGKKEEITNYLENKFKDVAVCDFEDIESINEKFDNILIYGLEIKDNILSKVYKALNEDGVILIAANNNYGINNWSKYTIEENKKHNISLNSIIDSLKSNSINNIYTFLAYPNYEETELLIQDGFKFYDSIFEKYNPSLNEGDIKIFDEVSMVKEIYNNAPDMLKYLANSYLIIASKEQIDNDIKCISYNNCRNQEYQLITCVQDDYVVKKATNDSSIKHIDNMRDIIERLKTDNIEILDYEKDGKIYSKRLKGHNTLDNLLEKKSDNLDFIIDILNKMFGGLKQLSESYEKCKDKIFLKDADEEMLKKLHYLKNGYWDMVPKNCFYVDDKFIFFDQEWIKEYIPVEFIIYRSIINSYGLVKKINVDELLDKLQLIKYKEYFSKLDSILRDEIINKETFKKMYTKKIITLNELIDVYKENDRIKNVLLADLREDNKKKQEYINVLENTVQEYEKTKNKIKRIMFWKR